jgi:APA family basic amino acid/polyamine antiporter
MRHQTGIGWFTCTAIVIANMVGTGVFTSLGFQVGALPSGFVLLTLWALGAVFALSGALCYAELAAALPRSGGEYNFLARIYGRPVGFMAGFLSATVGFAAPIALAAMAFAKYLHAALPDVPQTLASTLIVCVVTAAHLFTLRSSQVFQNFFTGFKLTLIAALVLAGWFLGPREPVSFLPVRGDGALVFSAPFAVSLMYVLYAYSGWNAATYIIGEVRRPARDVPWALVAGTLFVGVLYVALNAIFLLTVPMDKLAGHIDVGHLSAEAIFGPQGGRIMSGLICAGLVSSLSAMTWAGPRVAATIGEDFSPLRFLARRTRGGIPAAAVLLQLGIVLLLLWSSTFESVLLYTQVALVVCSLLAVVGVIVLRVRAPELPRPFRCWGYPVTPLLFAAIAIFTLVYTTIQHPLQAIAGLGTLLLGLGIYFIGRRVRAKTRSAA